MSRIEDCVKKLKVGTAFVECDCGREIDVICETVPQRSETGQWTWKAKTLDSRHIDYLITEGFEHYGPKVYLN